MLGLGRLFGRQARPQRDYWPLSQRLIAWSKQDAWTIGDSVTGTLILGSTGSGKTSGSGEQIATAFLAAGYGGLVLTAKPDERELWQRYCRLTRREDDLLIFGPREALAYNFLDFEMNRAGAGAGLTQNITALFESVIEVSDRTSGGGGRDEESFWKRSCRQLITNAVDLLALARGRISVPELYRLVISAPTDRQQLSDPSWQASSMCYRCLTEAEGKSKSPTQAADFQLVMDYFCAEWPDLSSKTRSVVLATFTSMIDVLNRGVMRPLFCGETNVTPEAIEAGRILLIDLPVKEFAEAGVFAQVIWKRAFQRHIERRSIAQSPRPVFLWADEAQYFVTSDDMLFQSTARSSRVATVYLSQNTSNFIAALGGSEKGRVEATSLFANLASKVFHCNADATTNEWASSLIGRTLQQFMNSNTSFDSSDAISPLFDGGRNGQTSAGFSQSYEYEVQPSVFSTLKTGGLENGGIVEGVLFQNGKCFGTTGRPWMPVSFLQSGFKKGGRRA